MRQARWREEKSCRSPKDLGGDFFDHRQRDLVNRLEAQVHVVLPRSRQPSDRIQHRGFESHFRVNSAF